MGPKDEDRARRAAEAVAQSAERKRARSAGAALAVGRPVEFVDVGGRAPTTAAILAWWRSIPVLERPDCVFVQDVAERALGVATVDRHLYLEVRSCLRDLGFHRQKGQFYRAPPQMLLDKLSQTLDAIERSRREDCAHYLDCLDYACAKDWDDFTCSQCSDYVRDGREAVEAALAIRAVFANRRRSEE